MSNSDGLAKLVYKLGLQDQYISATTPWSSVGHPDNDAWREIEERWEEAHREDRSEYLRRVKNECEEFIKKHNIKGYKFVGAP